VVLLAKYAAAGAAAGVLIANCAADSNFAAQ
jgi:hypothetical protein